MKRSLTAAGLPGSGVHANEEFRYAVGEYHGANHHGAWGLLRTAVVRRPTSI